MRPLHDRELLSARISQLMKFTELCFSFLPGEKQAK